MKQVILIRYSEIHLKGKNKGFFEKKLKDNLIKTLKPYNLKVSFAASRYVVSDFDPQYLNEICKKVKNTFGVYSFSVALEMDTSLKELEKYFATYILPTKTFKVSSKRADKTFEVRSTDLSAKIGGIVLECNKGSMVDVKTPQTVINIDIRENKKTYIFDSIQKAYGGMPVGTGGRALALLSGGIDSPVAIFKMASRGMQVDFVHFYSFPYTSEQAKQKVLDLAKILTDYTLDIRLYIVPFTSIQENINAHCKEAYMITIMRRFMIKIAHRIAIENDMQALITGESLAQVASQTVESLASTQEAVQDILVFRPLIASNKEEIVNLSKQIGTYETSILPFEDCCTVFTPKNPLIKPNISKVKEQEALLDVDNLINLALQKVEVIDIKN